MPRLRIRQVTPEAGRGARAPAKPAFERPAWSIKAPVIFATSRAPAEDGRPERDAAAKNKGFRNAEGGQGRKSAGARGRHQSAMDAGESCHGADISGRERCASAPNGPPTSHGGEALAQAGLPRQEHGCPSARNVRSRPAGRRRVHDRTFITASAIDWIARAMPCRGDAICVRPR